MTHEPGSSMEEAMLYDPEIVRHIDARMKYWFNTGFQANDVTLGNLFITNNIISSTLLNEDIIIQPNGTGQLLAKNDPISSMGVATKHYVDQLTIDHSITTDNIPNFTQDVDDQIGTQKGTPNGLATLNSDGKIPADQLSISSITYRGTWNASSNTPTIVSSIGIPGNYYIVATTGTTSIDGVAVWNVGDWILFNGSVWERCPQVVSVTSVAGKTGSVILTTADIASGTFPDARIAQSSILQYQSALDIRGLMNAPTGNIVGHNDLQTLSNKTINASNNTITELTNSNLANNAAIALTKIGNGDVSAAQLSYLNTITSNVQTQLDNKAAIIHIHDAGDITSGQFAAARISSTSVLQYQAGININSLTGAPSSLVVGSTDLQTLTNKTLDAVNNTIRNIGNNELKPNVNVNFLADGSVTNAEFQYLHNLTAPIQYQLDGKSASIHTHLSSDITDLSTVLPKANYNAVVSPTSSDDNSLGYTVGSRWINTDSLREYVCVDSSIGTAVWSDTTVADDVQIGMIIQQNTVTIAGGPHTTLDFRAPNGGATILNANNHVARITIDATVNDTDANLKNRANHTGTQLASTISDFTTASLNIINAQRGGANGIASLDPSGKIPMNQLSISSTNYQGTWNASTNTPTIISSTGTNNYYYIVNTAGTTTINGISNWGVGDWIIFDDGVISNRSARWERIANSQSVTSVNGKQGTVILVAPDITSGFFGDARISQSSVIQHQSAINISTLVGAPTSTVVGITDAQTLINKTINAANNIVSNIIDSCISNNAGINALKIADGSISNAEFQYLNNVSSNIQTQLDGKALSVHTHVATDITSGQLPISTISQAAVLQHQGAININSLSGAPTSAVIGATDNQTLTNKTLNAVNNTIRNIGNNELSSNVNVNFLADGSVTDAEYQYLHGVTSALQTQLNNKSTVGHSHVPSDITGLGTILPKSNYDGRVAPVNTDDIGQGYAIGSRWIDVVQQKEYVCIDATYANAIWTATTLDPNNQLANIGVKYQNDNVGSGSFSTLNFYSGVTGNSGAVSVSDLGNNTAKVVILATVNDTDANLKNRANHTGTQTASTISNFDTAINNSSHALNHNNPHLVTAAQIGLSNLTNRLDNYNANSIPDITNDSTQGYLLGSNWFDVSSSRLYVCTDSTINNAKWIEVVTQALGGDSTIITSIGTNDNTPINLVSIPTLNDTAYLIEASIVARRTDIVNNVIPSEVGAYKMNCLYKNDGGVLSEVLSNSVKLLDDQDWIVIASISNNLITIVAQGEVNKSISWKSSFKVLSV